MSYAPGAPVRCENLDGTASLMLWIDAADSDKCTARPRPPCSRPDGQRAPGTDACTSCEATS